MYRNSSAVQDEVAKISRAGRPGPSEHAGDTTTRRAAGRPRSVTSRRAVLDAAYAILMETGLGAFSVEAVAARSGVARTTIYRSWSTRGLLAMESFREALESQLAFDQSPHPEEDVRRLVRSLARALSGPAGRLAASVLAEGQSDPAVQQQFLKDFSDPLRSRSTEVLLAGVKSGIFRRELQISNLLDAIVGAVYLRLLFGLALDDDWADGLSSTLLCGCLV